LSFVFSFFFIFDVFDVFVLFFAFAFFCFARKQKRKKRRSVACCPAVAAREPLKRKKKKRRKGRKANKKDDGRRALPLFSPRLAFQPLFSFFRSFFCRFWCCWILCRGNKSILSLSISIFGEELERLKQRVEVEEVEVEVEKSFFFSDSLIANTSFSSPPSLVSFSPLFPLLSAPQICMLIARGLSGSIRVSSRRGSTTSSLAM